VLLPVDGSTEAYPLDELLASLSSQMHVFLHKSKGDVGVDVRGQVGAHARAHTRGFQECRKTSDMITIQVARSNLL